MKQQKEVPAERTQIYLPASLSKQLRDEASKNYRSISGEISFILEHYFTHQHTGESKPEGEELKENL